MSHFPRLTWEAITLQLRDPFRISYGVSETRQAFWLRLAEDEGWGEGTIPSYYGIRDEAITAVWQQAARRADPLSRRSRRHPRLDWSRRPRPRPLRPGPGPA
ncbi:MAG: hypothetical protein M5U34_12420 [Chloroflexi bacterium]|nr:hypothetical protein [Chloroflexota bacterium]